VTERTFVGGLSEVRRQFCCLLFLLLDC